MSKWLALLFVLVAAPAFAQQPVTVTNQPTCQAGSCTNSNPGTAVIVDADTGLPAELQPLYEHNTPFDVLTKGMAILCRGITASVDAASVDDSAIVAACDQWGTLRVMLSKGGTDVTLTGTSVNANVTNALTAAAGTGTLIRSDNTNNDDETQISGSATTLRSVRARNANTTTDAYLRCTNLTAANTTPGSSTVVYEMMIPFGGGFVDTDINMTFSTAMTCYIATGKAVTDATDAAQDDVSVVIITS